MEALRLAKIIDHHVQCRKSRYHSPSLCFYCSASRFFICHSERIQQFFAHLASSVPLFNGCDGLNTSKAPGSTALENTAPEL